jgi:hypothetical protein
VSWSIVERTGAGPTAVGQSMMSHLFVDGRGEEGGCSGFVVENTSSNDR